VTQASTASSNRFEVRQVQADAGWTVEILDPAGHVVWTRVCSGEGEARTFASTVRQHVSWLSEAKFREYYRIG
jgi:hypothetical protein